MNIFQFDPSKSILLIAEDIFISIHGHCIGKEMQRALIERIQCYFKSGRKITHSTMAESVIKAVAELYVADSRSKNIFTKLFEQRSTAYVSRFGRKITEAAPKSRLSIVEKFFSFGRGLSKA